MRDDAALAAWTAANRRARNQYAAYPTACAHWCKACINPIELRRCDQCRQSMRKRAKRKEKP